MDYRQTYTLPDAAGSEAVMPLTRIGGKLGVQSTGANVTVQPQIKINIVNNAGAKVETQQQTDNDGNINMTVRLIKSKALSVTVRGVVRVWQTCLRGSADGL